MNEFEGVMKDTMYSTIAAASIDSTVNDFLITYKDLEVLFLFTQKDKVLNKKFKVKDQ